MLNDTPPTIRGLPVAQAGDGFLVLRAKQAGTVSSGVGAWRRRRRPGISQEKSLPTPSRSGARVVIVIVALTVVAAVAIGLLLRH